MMLKWFRNTLRALAGVIVFFLALVFDFAITVGVIGLLVMGCKFLWEWYAKFSGG